METTFKNTAIDSEKNIKNLETVELVENMEKDEITKFLEEGKRVLGVDLEVKKNSKYKYVKALEYLKQHYMFRYNEEQKELLLSKNKKTFVYIEDFHYSNISNELLFSNYDIPDARLRHLILHPEICEVVSPLSDYFAKLKNWDRKTNFLQLYLEQVKLKDESKRTEFIEDFTKWFVGVVACAIHDTAVNQQCFVLIGEQTGQFKTTFLNGLVPQHLRLDYLYSGSYDFGNIDYQKFLFQKLLINIDEMSILNRHDEKVLKTVLTAPQFIGRLKFSKYDTKRFRRASFCGSTNDVSFLTDETGNRRYLVYEVDKIELSNKIKLDDIYSQALHLFNAGFKYWYDSCDIKEITGRNENFRNISNEENLISMHLEIPTEDEERESLYLAESQTSVRFWNQTQVNNYLCTKTPKLNLNETTSKRVGQILKRYGYIHKNRRVKNGESNRVIKGFAVKLIDIPNYMNTIGTGEDFPI